MKKLFNICLIGLLFIAVSCHEKKIVNQGNKNLHVSNEEENLCDNIRYGQTKNVKKLIAEGAKVNGPDQWGRIPLEIAVENGYVDIVNLLQDAGADFNIINKKAETLLHVAVKNDRGEKAIRGDPYSRGSRC